MKIEHNTLQQPNQPVSPTPDGEKKKQSEFIVHER